MPEVKAENSKNKKHLSLFLHKPFSYLFYLSDIFYDSVWLEFLGYFWYIECKLRGGKISKGHISGRPVFKFHPQCKIVKEDAFQQTSMGLAAYKRILQVQKYIFQKGWV